MRGAACAGDDDLEPARAGPRPIIVESLRGAMRRDDTRLMGDTELLEGLRRVLHRLPVGLAAHDDANGQSLMSRTGFGHAPRLERRCGARHYRIVAPSHKPWPSAINRLP